MGNIRKIELDELSEDAQFIVGQFDYVIGGGSSEVEIDVDASIEDIADAMKYIIDTGWVGCPEVYACRMNKTTPYGESIYTGVSTKPDFFTYLTDHKYFSIDENEPMVIGKVKYFPNYNKPVLGYHDGDVFIKLPDGTMLTKQEWIEQKPKQNIKKTNA